MKIRRIKMLVIERFKTVNELNPILLKLFLNQILKFHLLIYWLKIAILKSMVAKVSRR